MRFHFLILSMLLFSYLQLSSCNENNITSENETEYNFETEKESDSSQPSPQATSLPKRQGFIQKNIAKLVKKKQQSLRNVHKILQTVGTRSKNTFKRSKLMLKNA
eukprot:CAMPEP_0114484978 /NCGR_PEP_ID=MMETSP0104-20121206/19706_1 /TAXON_ID=37642 ORGANISM="Paraphysomonas imperforata, Strain PA2" /NCGR_SAMPLE_ID=MMETSP0104 /ASSEMBLY_ACC=CAM_ASM_000202 /LENGTH=104 /DNA_ID=CAMNT_0001661071 /DNA_START=103 /DNA_END=414 /DNA_ORIENTATION=-